MTNFNYFLYYLGWITFLFFCFKLLLFLIKFIITHQIFRNTWVYYFYDYVEFKNRINNIEKSGLVISESEIDDMISKFKSKHFKNHRFIKGIIEILENYKNKYYE